MIDDLITKGTQDPYRMFTSRAEYRLLLREDNADLRLRELGYTVGLVSEPQYEALQKRREAIEDLLAVLSEVRLNPTHSVNEQLQGIGVGPISQPTSLINVLKRPEASLDGLAAFEPRIGDFDRKVMEQVGILVKYDGYIRRQMEQVERSKGLEDIGIPATFDYASVPGLSNEVREKLSQIQPATLGQASRISGITPAAVSIVQVYLKRPAG
jgi:tRNA uridine 5-carboxymethylaminomethyl modification enzyme